MRTCYTRLSLCHLLPGDMAYIACDIGLYAEIDTYSIATNKTMKSWQGLYGWIRSVHNTRVLIIARYAHDNTKIYFYALTDDGTLGWMAV